MTLPNDPSATPNLPPPAPAFGPAPTGPDDATQPAFPAVAPTAAPAGWTAAPASTAPASATPSPVPTAPAPFAAPMPAAAPATPTATGWPVADQAIVTAPVAPTAAAGWPVADQAVASATPAQPGLAAAGWVPAEPAPALPPYAPAPGWAAVEPAPSAPQRPAPRQRRGVTPALLVVAMIGTAVLTAGTTYVAVEATHPAASAPANQLAAAPGNSGSNAQPNGGSNSTGGGTAPSLTPANPLPAGGQAAIPEIVKAVGPAVVTITAEGITSTDPTTGQTGTGTAVGSGVIFDASGLVLTNHHVVSGNPSKLTVTLKDGRTLDASIYGIDTMTDLAIVKINGASGLPTAPIGTSATIQVGQQTIAIGSPLGDLTGSVTSGIVSALGRSIDVENESLTNLIQTDTPINPGNSGGPLLDAGGNVIGINTAVSTNAQNIGFSIPIDIAKPMLAQASAGQPLARAWLGVRFKTIDPTIQKDASLPVANGAWIPSASALQQGTGAQPSQDPNAQGQTPNPDDPFGIGQIPGFGSGQQGSGQQGSGSGTVTGSSIVAGSPAAKAGLAEGDIITAVDGTNLDATHTLDLLLGQRAPGTQVTLSVLRNGQTSSVSVTLGTRPQSA